MAEMQRDYGFNVIPRTNFQGAAECPAGNATLLDRIVHACSSDGSVSSIELYQSAIRFGDKTIVIAFSELFVVREFAESCLEKRGNTRIGSSGWQTT